MTSGEAFVDEDFGSEQVPEFADLQVGDLLSWTYIGVPKVRVYFLVTSRVHLRKVLDQEHPCISVYPVGKDSPLSELRWLSESNYGAITSASFTNFQFQKARRENDDSTL